jgi:hypothetical protein
MPSSRLTDHGIRVFREGDAPATDDVRFTVGTLVNDRTQYQQMLESFHRGGFTGDSTEYLYIDNTARDQTCAYRGLNAILGMARGRLVILCHQDVRLFADDMEALTQRIDELQNRDPLWALAGNAGGVAPGALAMRITDPHGEDQNSGNLPAQVVSLDENFIVVRRSARIGFSADLSGFHFYGADICLQAELSGYRSYVIDFHLTHLSAGNKSDAFHKAQDEFCGKWNRVLTSRWIQTTCALVQVGGTAFEQAIGRVAAGPYAKAMRHLPKKRTGVGLGNT